MGRLKKAIITKIQEREPAAAPGFIINANGDLVRHIAQQARRPIIHQGTFKMAEVWPQSKD